MIKCKFFTVECNSVASVQTYLTRICMLVLDLFFQEMANTAKVRFVFFPASQKFE